MRCPLFARKEQEEAGVVLWVREFIWLNGLWCIRQLFIHLSFFFCGVVSRPRDQFHFVCQERDKVYGRYGVSLYEVFLIRDVTITTTIISTIT